MDDEKYLRMAYAHALHSPDPSTQNGAVIVSDSGLLLGVGCNEFPHKVAGSSDRLERPTKYNFVEHAERNAIYNAARLGNKTQGAIMYCPWFACADCGRAIIQAGIKKVIGHQRMFDATPERWADSIADAFTMFAEAGVETEMLPQQLDADAIRFNGELWVP